MEGDIVPEKGKSKRVDAIKDRADVDRVREYFRGNYRHGDLYALLWTCGCNMGMRAGDLRHLTAGDIAGCDWFDFREQKTKKLRRVYVNDRVRAEYDRYISKYALVEADSRLFPSQKGYPVELKHIHKMCKQACRKLEIPGNYGSHTMRKTFAYHAFRAEPTKQRLELIRAAFGHSTTYVTRLYTGFTEDEVDVEDTDICGEIRDVYMGLDL